MQLLTNEIEPDAVRRQTENGTEYLTAPVVMAKAMPLNGGYLPQSEIKASAGKWDGIDVPIGHPTKNGQAVSVESDHNNSVIGEVRNAKAEGEKLLGELWLNIQKAKRAGTEGVQVLSRLAGGEPLEVSTAYIPNTVEENAEADGKTRRKVVRDIDPDHLAVLPNEKGKCSIADGCGAPRVNQLIVPMTDDAKAEDMDTADTMHGNKQVDGIRFSGTASGKLDESEIPNDDFASHYVFDGETKTDSSYPLVDAEGNLRAGNVESAYQLFGRAPDPDKLLSVLEEVNNEFDTPPIDPDDLKESMSSNADSEGSGAVGWLLNFLGMDGDGNEPAESGVDPAATNTMDRDTDAHDYLVNEHGYDRDNLPPAGSDCIEKMEQNHRQLDDMTGDDDPETNADDPDVEALVEEKVNEALAANEQSELVDDILANTDEFDRETLEQSPEAVLEEIHDNVTQAPAAGMPANTGRKSVNTDDEYSGPTDFGEYIAEAE